MNLNITNWKEFRVGDLFFVGGSKTTPKEDFEEIGCGKYPYVTTSAINNGVEGFYDAYTEDGNLIVVESACMGFATYQATKFSASDHVELLKPKFQMSKNIGLFIVTLINNENFRYSYGRKCNQVKIKNMIIKLPVDNSGNPNREFMENYIKSLKYKPIKTKNKPGKNKLNIHERKDFKVGDVLECSTTKLSIKDDLDIGEIPLISRTAMNNGCDGYFDIEQSKITQKGCITIGAEGIYAFYQPEDFGTGNKVYTLKNDKLNKYSALFICTILNKEDYKYSYGRARILSKIVDEIIKLPVDSSGNPDREFMENYIKNLPYGDRI